MSALLALSDVLVVRALERAYSRGLTGSKRRDAAHHGPRHCAYMVEPIPAARHTHALDGAWDMCDDLVFRWQLPVPAETWSYVLDEYARGLLKSQAPHSLDALEQALRLLGAGHAA